MYRRALGILIGIGFCLPLTFLGCSSEEARETTSSELGSSAAVPKVTFVELGSVKCIPCRQMQPVMKSIERKYGNQIKVVFHDVWKEPRHGKKYSIRLIPTQVFLDKDKREIMRHEGFLPETKIDQFLQSRGLKVLVEPKAQ